MSETGNGRKNRTRVVAAVGLVFLAVALGGNALGGGKFSLMGSVIGAHIRFRHLQQLYMQ